MCSGAMELRATSTYVLVAYSRDTVYAEMTYMILSESSGVLSSHTSNKQHVRIAIKTSTVTSLDAC